MFSSHQWRYLLIAQSLLPLVINVLICGAIGAIDYRHLDILPVWGFPKSVALDLLGTSFLLPTITCWIATLLVRRDVRRGSIDALRKDSPLPAWLQFFRRPLLWRAPLFGVLGLIVAGSAVLIVLRLLPVAGTNVSTFLAGKLAFAGIDGAIVTPLNARVAMTEEPAPVITDRLESLEKPAS